KEIALANNTRGSLADAAEGQAPELRDRGNASARRILDALTKYYAKLFRGYKIVKDAHKKDDDKNQPADIELTRSPEDFPPIQGVFDQDGNRVFTIDDAEEVELEAIANLPQETFTDINPGPYEGNDTYSDNVLEEIDLNDWKQSDDQAALYAARRLPRTREVMRRLDIIADQLRRRLPWSRLTEEQKNRVNRALPPGFRLRNRPGDEQVLWEADDYDPPVSWWRRLGRRGARIRLNWMQKIMWRFLLPVSLLSPGVALYYREGEGEKEDELITLWRALPDDNWFKQSMDLFSWAKLIPMTPRADNYLLLKQVGNAELLHYRFDVNLVQVISRGVKNMKPGNPGNDWTLNLFKAFKADMAYRATHNTQLTKIVTTFDLGTSFGWGLVCAAQGSDPHGLHVMAAFFESGLQVDNDLRWAITKANGQATAEHQGPFRELKYQDLIAAFSNAIKFSKDFRTPWMKEMMVLYHSSKFDATLEKLAFTNVLRQLEVNATLYQDSARSVLEDFLRRYTKDGDPSNVLPFQHNLHALKYGDDIFAPVSQLLQAMANYRNDGRLDKLAYELLNKKWEPHNAQTPYDSFAAAMASFDLSEKHKVVVQAAVESMQNGLMPFVETVRHELKTKPVEEDGLPAELVGLSKVVSPPEEELSVFPINSNVPFADNSRALVPFENSPVPAVVPSSRSVGSGKKVMAAVPAWIDYETVPFFRVENTVVLQLGDVPVVMAVNDNIVQIAAFPAPENDEGPYAMEVWQKPVEQSNSGGLVLAKFPWFTAVAQLAFLVTMTIMAAFIVAERNHVGPERMAAVTLGKVATVVVGGGKLVVNHFVALPFKEQLMITGGIGVGAGVVVYRKEIADALTRVTTSGAQLIAIVVAVSLLATASDFYSASQGRKKRKL
ncbi:MAG: hypothetical protein JSS98_17425, partial [Bacteroidetes bacterium]|nr:hypothetical protein [Bacteroidota bacterium]